MTFLFFFFYSKPSPSVSFLRSTLKWSTAQIRKSREDFVHYGMKNLQAPGWTAPGHVRYNSYQDVPAVMDLQKSTSASLYLRENAKSTKAIVQQDGVNLVEQPSER